jgi:hypothetical protein
VLLTTQPDLDWVYDWPYWESTVFDSETGLLFPTFDWAIKKFSSSAIAGGLAGRLRSCAEMIERERQGNQTARSREAECEFQDVGGGLFRCWRS